MNITNHSNNNNRNNANGRMDHLLYESSTQNYFKEIKSMLKYIDVINLKSLKLVDKVEVGKQAGGIAFWKKEIKK